MRLDSASLREAVLGAYDGRSRTSSTASLNMPRSVDKLDRIRTTVQHTDLAADDFGTLGVTEAAYAAYVSFLLD